MSLPLNEPLVCLSHLDWSFVYQRPQHVMTRFARSRPVFYVEEPAYETGARAHYRESQRGSVTVLKPVVAAGADDDASVEAQRHLLAALLRERGLEHPILWYYTPMALAFSDTVVASARIYDCMDELSLFAHAPKRLLAYEAQLLRDADLVFTGGRSLYAAKRTRSSAVHCFPSAVDAEHFRPGSRPEPADLASIARPRLGYYGVIDERFDCALVAGLAALRPAWQLIFVGPVVKIDPVTLPQADNIHYLGMKSYDELPAYLDHWDIAIQPFARNDATRFISPTKTLEFLAARKRVISTAIADVVDPYGNDKLVAIANTAADFAAAGDRMLAQPADDAWYAAVRAVTAAASWDHTAAAMEALVAGVLERRAVGA